MADPGFGKGGLVLRLSNAQGHAKCASYILGGVWGHAPQEDFGALRLILMQCERDNQS